ncbi:Response regulator PleD [Andreprevotia sp. IGB-42]|uniref:GGDEF domain-containing protein n=1 Tax=Andreprevotia sp. IGB-42 TaxID=2497473 RepID=UPI0013583E76|nr:GGDEF domain-containing protein [Andreprevotia sp. IGB-42]KAF0813175.1 Response regulator PleD [Andreprevotia sp. IGB-42]
MSFPRLLRFSTLFLTLLTVTLLVWHQYGMNRVLRIDGSSPYKMEAVDDRLTGGGSRASLKRVGTRLHVECQLSDKYEWPFCELGIPLTKPQNGLDFSDFDHVTLKVAYQGPGSRQLRFFIRNFDPAYSKPAANETWKINEVTFSPKPGGEVIEIPLKSFTVTSWWIANNHIPLAHIAVDMRHVPLIQFSTSGFKEPGLHVIDIDYIEFHGKWLSREMLALILVGLWVSFAILALLLDLQLLQRKLQRSRLRENTLHALTEALQLENRKIGDMARRDPLTGVRNRAGVLDELFRESELARNSERQLAMVYADIDHFKRVNDEHGHDVGDDVLKQFAQELGSHIRTGDYLVRWGGEEFVMFFPNTALLAASQLAEKMRRHVETVTWPSGLRITCSFGVTVLGNEPVADFIKRADEALYEAKGNGRNCVVTREAPLPARAAVKA